MTHRVADSSDPHPPSFYIVTHDAQANLTSTEPCWTHWSAAVFAALAKHPWRTKSKKRADILFLAVETRFEVN